MRRNALIVAMTLASVLALTTLAGCSREKIDWKSAEAADTVEGYDHFLERHPDGELAPQARARVAQLNEDRDWKKASAADTADAYRQFLAQHDSGKWSEEARIRVENFTLSAAPPNAAPAGAEATSAQPAPSAAPTPAAPPKPAAAMAMKPAPSKAPSTVRVAGKSQGSFGIQLGAFKSGADAANKRWSKLDQEYPKLLSGLSPTVSPKKGASGTLYRLQVANLSEKRANSICTALKAHSQACVLIHP